MNSEIAEQCRHSFYTELYQFPDSGQSLLLDMTTGRICLKKVLSVYCLQVFQYLQQNPHRNIPRIYWLEENDQKLTVVEEWIQGETLEQKMLHASLSDSQKTDVILQLCDALSWLHHASPAIIHRDLKPSNIMLTDDGTVKLIDYDASRVYRKDLTRDTRLLGTDGSAAPEQYGFRQSDGRTDIYALGILIRQLFPDNSRMLKIADRATQMDPDERYPDIEAMRRAVCGRSHGIPGFRSHTPWKMLTAVIGYILIFYFSLTLRVYDVRTTAELWVYRVSTLATLLSLVLIFTDRRTAAALMPPTLSHKTFVRVLGYIAASAILIVGWLFLAVIICEIMAG